MTSSIKMTTPSIVKIAFRREDNAFVLLEDIDRESFQLLAYWIKNGRLPKLKELNGGPWSDEEDTEDDEEDDEESDEDEDAEEEHDPFEYWNWNPCKLASQNSKNAIYDIHKQRRADRTARYEESEKKSELETGIRKSWDEQYHFSEDRAYQPNYPTIETIQVVYIRSPENSKMRLFMTDYLIHIINAGGRTRKGDWSTVNIVKVLLTADPGLLHAVIEYQRKDEVYSNSQGGEYWSDDGPHSPPNTDDGRNHIHEDADTCPHPRG
ncbi:uncharacterized protein PAC_17016 [Phialocephala subalpina]|uniref:Uncharacterized protein n=1 Tax=Phialocephala subalpina TaxID=576137 RepID=A0A1L7XQA5_9HELO|nr:uncharacterized protein PAC_17016 [Phialocephala subalpina]